MSVVSDNTALNYKVVIEQWIRRRDEKISSLDLTETLPFNLSGGTMETK
jgi:hypothetical protein